MSDRTWTSKEPFTKSDFYSKPDQEAIRDSSSPTPTSDGGSSSSSSSSSSSPLPSSSSYPNSGQPFEEIDGEQSTIGAPWQGSGGSGTTPVIVSVKDYWLRDEAGDIITDENDDAISLEGMG